jgi:hypothetical protein
VAEPGFGDDLERPRWMRGVVGRTGLRFRGRPAGESDEPGGLRGADAKEPHHLAAGQRTAVPVQLGNQFGVGALSVRDAVA